MMKTQAIKNRMSKRGLSVLRTGLALAFCLLGVGFLCAPWMVEELTRAGVGPGFRLLLAATHALGGLALLAPRWAGEAAVGLALCVVGSALYLRGEGVGIGAALPIVLVLALLVFDGWLRHRRRVVASVWTEMLGRYADQQDSPRSENA